MKEFSIFGLPHAEAHNPTLITWQQRTLMMYRVGGCGYGELYLGILDGKFLPAGNFHKVVIPGQSDCQDPRFFIHRNQLHFSFVVRRGERQCTGIGIINDDLTVRDCRVIENTGSSATEKNWIFFPDYDEDLCFTYAMSDGMHQVYRLTGDGCEPVYFTHFRHPWKWGRARGGTPLIAHEGLWDGFFHGISFNDEQLERRYFMGAYAVSPKPPHPIVSMSRTPLYTPPESRLCASSGRHRGYVAAVIFPSGLIRHDGTWLVAAGYNDHAIRMFSISDSELKGNLIQTEPDEERAVGQARAHWSTGRNYQALVHLPLHDRHWSQPLEFAAKFVEEGETVFAHDLMFACFPKGLPYVQLTVDRLGKGATWLILHKDCAGILGLEILQHLKHHFSAVFANEVFVVFTNKMLPALETTFDPVHVEALWAKVASIDRPVESPESVAPGKAYSSGPVRINVGILTHNALEYTKRCINSLKRFATGPYNIFILDNGSEDGTCEWLAQLKDPNFHCEPSPVNLGVVTGRNRLIEIMLPHLPKDGFVFFLDNDTEMTGLWQDPFLKLFASHPEIGIVGKTGHKIIVHEESRELLPAPELHATPVDVMSGFTLWIRTATLRQVGGFDETLGLFWHEDDDYSVRAIAAGWEVVAMPDAPVFHHGHKSGAAFPGISSGGSPKNQSYLVRKWRKMGLVDRRGRIIHAKGAWVPPESRFPKQDRYWTQVLEAAQEVIGPADVVIAHEYFLEYFPDALPYLMLTEQILENADWIIFHKDCTKDTSLDVMKRIKEGFDPAFANEVFVLFADRKQAVRKALRFEFSPVHVEALWVSVEALAKTLSRQPRNRRGVVDRIKDFHPDQSQWPPAVTPTTEAGIVISACGRLFKPLFANLRNIRARGCKLPIDVWHLPGEFTASQIAFLSPMTNFVDGGDTPFNGLSGRHEVHGFKAWMLSQSRFWKTLMLDVNSFPLKNMEDVFKSGRNCIMWRDGPWGCCYEKTSQLRRSLNLMVHPVEFESGQLYVDKHSARTRDALRLAAALNTLGSQLYTFTHGDKETYSIAFDLLGESFSIAPEPSIHPAGSTTHVDAALIQPWLDGSGLFYHPLGPGNHWWRFGDEWTALEKEAVEAEASCR